MGKMTFSDLEFSNLVYALSAWGDALRDPVAASSRYRFPASTAQRLSQMSAEELLGMVCALGDNPLVLPRSDFETLMDNASSALLAAEAACHAAR